MDLFSTTHRHFRLLPIVADILNPCLVPVLADLHRLLTLTVHSHRQTRVLRFDLMCCPRNHQVGITCVQLFMRGYWELLGGLGIKRQYLWVRSDWPGLGWDRQPARWSNRNARHPEH